MSVATSETLDNRGKTDAVTVTDTQGPNGGSPDHDGGADRRVTVNLSHLSVIALSVISGALGVNKTEAINRALRFYGEITQLMEAGGAVYVREPGGKELERIRIY